MDQIAFLPFLPTFQSETRLVANLMFYGLERPLSRDWVQLIEQQFVRYSLEPQELCYTAHSKDKSGDYSSLKSELEDALSCNAKYELKSIRVRSKAVAPEDGFLPCDMEISVDTGGPTHARGSISVSIDKAPDLEEFATQTSHDVSRIGGCYYGHSSLFPAILGPEYYLGSVGTIPKGWSFISTRAYTKRLTAWRDHGANRISLNGYFREVFPYNFLTKHHLNQRILGKPAADLFKEFGTLEEFGASASQYVWKVPLVLIPKAREVLEEANLVLSAR